jgi:glycosyltransferase involved in cell wall biosynthesis
MDRSWQRQQFEFRPRVAVPIRQRRRPLRVLFVGDPRSTAHPGGGEVQLRKTAEYLTRLGVDVSIVESLQGDLPECDWVHLFGTVPEFLLVAQAAKHAGARVALSTISWYDPWVNWKLEPSVWRRVRGVAGWAVRRALPNVPSWRRELMHVCDVLLPNSRAEAAQLEQLFGVDRSRIDIVPNGVDERFGHADPTLFEEQFQLHNFVLLPGRVEPRKNQLTVIRALWGSGVPVVVLGDAHPDHGAYMDACRSEADSGVTFVPRLDHDSALLASAYAAARVVVLASWFETPGLAALEGALAGARIVVTDRGSAREYFGERARYVQPDDALAIRQAVREEFLRPTPSESPEAIRQQFLWDRVAEQTFAAYRRLDGTDADDLGDAPPRAIAA